MNQVERRTWVAAGVLLLWLAGLGLLARRQLGKSVAERLAEAAVRVEPATYYYMVLQGATQVGAVTSSIDTSAGGFTATDAFSGRLVIYGDSQSVEASSTAYLSRRFMLDSFALTVGGEQKPWHVVGRPKTPPDSGPVLLPSLLPVAFLLSYPPEVGRSASYWMYNPIGSDVIPVTLRIAAESLFTVSDSARYDSAAGRWVPAHTDTVRAWSFAPGTSGLMVWVDAQGRVVSASEPGGMRAVRAPYELAFTNWRSTLPAAQRRLLTTQSPPPRRAPRER